MLIMERLALLTESSFFTVKLGMRPIVSTRSRDLNYGQLKSHPYWDTLRGGPRFEKIVASLVPK